MSTPPVERCTEVSAVAGQGPAGLGGRPDRTWMHTIPSTRLPILAVSDGMRSALELAYAYAHTTLPVLIVGPTGTGKELLAQAIHEWSGRPGRMVDVNCGALPQEMVAREFFGHRKGAFTSASDSAPGLFEAADHGTLFLDELCSLSSQGQQALLRVVESGRFTRIGETHERSVNVRLLGAMQVEQRAGQLGAFRADLLHRLGGGLIRIPALNERPEDIWPLACCFAAEIECTLTVGARVVLEGHSWPGNVRELRNVISRAGALARAQPLDGTAVVAALAAGGESSMVGEAGAYSPADKAALLQLIHDCALDVAVMARRLGVHRATAYRMLERAGIRITQVRAHRRLMQLSQVVAPGRATSRDSLRRAAIADEPTDWHSGA